MNTFRRFPAWMFAFSVAATPLSAVAFQETIKVALPDSKEAKQAEPTPTSDAEKLLESKLIGDARQLTFEGKRAGEGYFSADGSKLVFQSERDPANPFFQIYLLDRETGDVEKISPGHGKTTCAWVHPDNNRVLFGSTQFDPEAVKKQQAELEFRNSGQQKRYSWDYDPTYDLVEFDRQTGKYQQLNNRSSKYLH